MYEAVDTCVSRADLFWSDSVIVGVNEVRAAIKILRFSGTFP